MSRNKREGRFLGTHKGRAVRCLKYQAKCKPHWHRAACAVKVRSLKREIEAAKREEQRKRDIRIMLDSLSSYGAVIRNPMTVVKFCSV